MIISKERIEKCKIMILKDSILKLAKLEKYCNLLDGDLGTYVSTHDLIGDMPEQIKEWLKIFDGGLLFSTSMFSTRKSVEKKFCRLLTFSEVNSPDFKQKNGIPEEVICFAMTNYGNYYCYVSNENTGCVYEYDPEQNALTVKWDTFVDWLNERISTAEKDINDGVLRPMEV